MTMTMMKTIAVAACAASLSMGVHAQEVRGATLDMEVVTGPTRDMDYTKYAIEDGITSFASGCSWQHEYDESRFPTVGREILLSQPPAQNDDLPANWDWRDVDKQSFVTQVYTQLAEFPCGSCWALSATGALSDRLKLERFRKYGRVMVDVDLSPQVLINCGSNKFTGIPCGSCGGGSAYLAYKFIQKFGITDRSCAPYTGQGPTHWAEVPCEQTMCRTCDIKGTCSNVEGKKYFVDAYGLLDGKTLGPERMVNEMKKEIYNNGPIVCNMWAHSDGFENYTGGILSDDTKYPGTTHDIALIGYGVDETTGTPYWIGRNSFGTRWGEEGFFRIEQGKDTLNIETSCTWATIKDSNL
eukprot:GFYU01006789.1.p1 GENE.GFYU01006789.1~~GFYU01006789.1.p1  ORF type:complete len:355 (-),score=99.03 GFYU01006789.1:591-1655(-)